MSEIKFACPHCRQHIACDSDYASLGIECPSCGGAMVVPRLTSSSSAHSDAVLVASLPSPKPRPIAQPPTLGAWTNADWERHYDEVTEATAPPSPSWLVAAFGALIVAAVLRANQSALWLIIVCLVAGGVVAGILAAKNKGGNQAAGYQVLRVLVYVGGAIILLPVFALGILFLGCAVCH